MVGCAVGSATPCRGQQVLDTIYRPRVEAPVYARGAGPLIGLDAAHNNPPWESDAAPLRRLLEADGYRIEPIRDAIGATTLDSVRVLIIVDALADENVDNWTLPVPSAMDSGERERISSWVRSGGSLLLVADHMPFAGAVEDLAAEFGVELLNGFAIDTVAWDPIIFRRSDGTLRGQPITNGRNDRERIDSVYTYWGHAMRGRNGSVQPLLVFSGPVVSYQPREAWRFNGPDTGVVDVAGWSQAVAVRVGAGRVVILGDSGMLSAYLVGANRQPAGMNSPAAVQNEQFVLNAIHWLTGLIGQPESRK